MEVGGLVMATNSLVGFSGRVECIGLPNPIAEAALHLSRALKTSQRVGWLLQIKQDSTILNQPESFPRSVFFQSGDVQSVLYRAGRLFGFSQAAINAAEPAKRIAF